MSAGDIIVAYTHAPEETERVGALVGAALDAGACLALAGDLAAGKTVFVRGLAAGLGADPALVHSPTFTLLHVYHGRLPLYHFDLYRLDDPAEIDRLGFAEYLYDSDGVAAVEWGDKFAAAMPGDAVWLTFLSGEEPGLRRIELRCADPTERERLAAALGSVVREGRA